MYARQQACRGLSEPGLDQYNRGLSEPGLYQYNCWGQQLLEKGWCQEPYCKIAGKEVPNHKLEVFIVVPAASCRGQRAKLSFGSVSYETGTWYPDTIWPDHPALISKHYAVYSTIV